MRTIGDLALIKESVSSLATVSLAVRLMNEHGVRVMPVIDDGAFRGVVTRERALLSAPDAPVRDIIATLVLDMPESSPVRYAARLFVENGLDFVPVMRGDDFVGLLTATQLLVELGRSWDPMTGLSWSDRLRDWGSDALDAGKEITLVFFDLDGFGAYNKRHGHIVGDRIIKAMAQSLTRIADSDRDILVRYGGDEFVLGSVRPRIEVEASVTHDLTGSLRVEGVAEDVTYSVGVSGGKRTRERERIHYASTVDNLINLASRDCMANKPLRSSPSGRPETGQPVERTCIVEVERDNGTCTAMASVSLSGTSAMAAVTGDSDDLLGLAARAVSRALNKIRPEIQAELEDAVVYRRWDGRPVAIVDAVVSMRQGSVKVRSSASSPDGVYSALGDALTDCLLKGAQDLVRSGLM
ncbi:MAG: diguanylate cyclase [Armatimonadetes bacterium]|nr:diguanylate cyclase [Armatimonadota bacterium]